MDFGVRVVGWLLYSTRQQDEERLAALLTHLTGESLGVKWKPIRTTAGPNRKKTTEDTSEKIQALHIKCASNRVQEVRKKLSIWYGSSSTSFPDGTVGEYAANILADALYAQVDVDKNRYLLLKEIVSHKKDQTALSKEDYTSNNFTGSRNPTRRLTTKGCYLQCQWTDGSTSWEPLRNLKESNPLELAQYAESHSLLEEPAFIWWAKDALKRSRRIIKRVKSKYWQRSHKYGIRLPKSVQEALQLDQENGNTLWHDAIQKELKNVKVAFKFLSNDEPTPVGYKQIPCHIIFDIKMDFT